MKEKILITISCMLLATGILLWYYAIHSPHVGFDNLGYGIIGFALTVLGLISTIASLIYSSLKKYR
ncbi:hypothetical protein PAECIP111891_04218 [Paenibacillus allorhizoplanae]|uniref:DUF3955 domain-containing protein n=1 Tax=Paenibacillus allorhizoplanae TaxID=2905648 RepID=A0ABM9CJY8_9BACL|nr:hypothetical protein PAECIP111891_04218 [Paenibacillus allorhizoplanae]